MSAFAPLPDQRERDRFCTELETNYSVIAPAGVGKTTSIVARIIEIAKADASRLDDPILPTLVVVTYTKKAADEMLSRVRTELDRSQPHADVHAHLAQAFFGTIHSFCQRLLLLAGPLCGFPGEVEVATDKDRLWESFRLEMGSGALPRLPDDLRKAFSIHGKWEDVFTLAKDWPGRPTETSLPGLAPRVNGASVIEIKLKRKPTKNVLIGQKLFQQWVSDVSLQLKSEEPLPCPEPKFKLGGGPFQAAWHGELAPLRRWREQATRYLAAKVATSFAQYRRRSGHYTFDDLISFAGQLLEDKEACSILRRRGWRVILDEAQDTDPQQFTILTEVTRPEGAKGSWIDGSTEGPRPGAFSMVGDPQQSIYSDRADLGRYLAVHNRLIEDGGAQATFSVTMRCPVKVVQSLNAVFPDILKPSGPMSRQVEYVTLDNPDQAPVGQIVRHKVAPPNDEIETKAEPRQTAYVQVFSQWLNSLTPQDLGTDSWAKVAILCPRNRWLDALSESLTAVGLPISQISRSAKREGDPVYAWYAAILTVFAQPRNNFELYGVLRDVFGFQDDALACYINSHYDPGAAHPLRIDLAPEERGGEISEALSALNGLYQDTRQLPLYSAVEKILKDCQIEERLAQVPGIDEGSIRSTMDSLQQQAAEAESKQLNLDQWAEEQRRALSQATEEKESSEAAITLVTTHKSKGLGFDVVILPFFFRRFGTRTETYPRFESGGEGAPRILFGAEDRDDGAKEWNDTRRHELHERLLYVGLTRVKRSLVLFDDNEWWCDLKNQRGESWAQILKVVDEEEANRKVWLGLPKQLNPPEEKNAEIEAPKATPKPEGAPEIVKLSESSFWRRVTPSSLQRHEEPSERIEPDLTGDERFPEEVRELYLKDPAAYGNWWHDMMEYAPWEMDEDIVRMHFTNTFKKCPDPNRGAMELEVFLESELFAQLVSKSWQVHTEVPFLAGDVSSKTGYEGFIDLLAIDVESGKWQIIDWKTDRMPDSDPMKALKFAYAPQLEVYDAALRESLGENGESCLYSTVTGETVRLQ